MAAPELLSLLAPEFLALGGNSPELVAADPFEYEITASRCLPHASGAALEPNLCRKVLRSPSGRICVRCKRRRTRPPAGKPRAEQESEVALCHPQSLEPAVGIRTAGRVGLPPAAALEAPQAVAPIESSLQVLEMEPAPVTSIDLEVPVQSDVLLQLLDQQVPHPDRLHALGQFAAHQSVFAMACPPPQQFDATPDTALPAAVAPAIAADYQLVFSTEIAAAFRSPAPGAGIVRKPHDGF